MKWQCVAEDPILWTKILPHRICSLNKPRNIQRSVGTGNSGVLDGCSGQWLFWMVPIRPTSEPYIWPTTWFNQPTLVLLSPPEPQACQIWGSLPPWKDFHSTSPHQHPCSPGQFSTDLGMSCCHVTRHHWRNVPVAVPLQGGLICEGSETGHLTFLVLHSLFHLPYKYIIAKKYVFLQVGRGMLKLSMMGSLHNSTTVSTNKSLKSRIQRVNVCLRVYGSLILIHRS